VDHAKEAGVVDVEVVVSAEGAPPVIERHSQDFVRVGPLQAHEPGLPNHLQLDHAPLLVVVRLLEVH
jgi:AmiR/NasT family two-component response regulator